MTTRNTGTYSITFTADARGTHCSVCRSTGSDSKARLLTRASGRDKHQALNQALRNVRIGRRCGALLETRIS